MMSKTAEGRLFQIAWMGHTDPPAGAPRVLCEYYAPVHPGGKVPESISDFNYTLGGGYSLCSSSVAKPTKQLPPETLAGIRKKRITRRIAAKVPMFADHFVAEAMAKNQSYFDGVTDPKIQNLVEEMAARDLARYEFWQAHPNELIVYAQEPPECKERAARLKAEMDEIKRKAEERRREKA